MARSLPLVLLLLGCARTGPSPSAQPAASAHAPAPSAGVTQGAGSAPGSHGSARAVAGGGQGELPPAPAGNRPLLEVVVRGYQVSDDDGSRPARVTPKQVQAWVATANQAFAEAGIRFRLDQTQGLLSLHSSMVNRAMPDRDVRKLDAALQPVIERHPKQLVVLFRHGPDQDPTAVAFSGLFVDYVVMPGFEGTHHCGHDQQDALAHELGHFLGLPHTFVKTLASKAAAEQLFRAKGRDRSVFDGDGFEDTAPDPGIVPMECTGQPAVELAGVRFQLPRDNLMSYYRQRSGLSTSQRNRVRWVLQERQRHGMTIPINRPERPMEAERLTPVGRAACRTQSMVSFRRGRWSGDQQQFCTGPASFRLWVATPGRYQLQLYATRAPDFGQLQVGLDGTPVGTPFEAWAPVVLPSGPIVLAEQELTGGAHVVDFGVVGRHPEATADKYGVDALELVRMAAP